MVKRLAAAAAAAMTELEELLAFLSSPLPQVRKAAVDIVRDLTGSADGLLSLAHYADIVLPALFRLLGEKKEFSESAAEALVNLSQNLELSTKMVSLDMITTTMDMLYKREPGITRLLIMLLVNLTQFDAGIASLLQIGEEKIQGLYIKKLVRSFCTSSSEKEEVFEHIGSILVNISKIEAGRKFLLDPKNGLLKQIIRQSDSASQVRKKGVSGTIRNCCFEAENQLHNLLLTSEFLWPALLLPVAGKKVYNEEDTSKMPLELASALSIERELVDDPEIRTQSLESLYLISLQDAGRRALWSVNGPRILQVGYEDEEDPKVMEAYEQIGSLLVQGSDIGKTSAQIS
ncbi:hypothetical protein Sjap_023892 [Stephania japonica]|uniref:Protein HGH1 homolog n=1 Tax=Stephania japonica TaxID=461633 RepID=A0AAP0ECH3_9MAGN